MTLYHTITNAAYERFQRFCVCWRSICYFRINSCWDYYETGIII